MRTPKADKIKVLIREIIIGIKGIKNSAFDVKELVIQIAVYKTVAGK